MARFDICVLTATRAEYGLLKPVIAALSQSDECSVRLAVTGMHLSEEFGLTYKEIEKDGYNIDVKIPILSGDDSPAGISKTMAAALIGFADYFAKHKPDLLVVLGDRYETLAVCTAAMNERIPIAHLHGGETTEGAADEAYRHSITKMSMLHFTSTEEYRNRVIQLGEAPERVFCVGATGVENIMNTPLMSKAELKESIGVSEDLPLVSVTFHPVTLENSTAAEQTDELIKFLESREDLFFVITKANADTDGRIINKKIDEYVATHKNAVAFASLGLVRYLSLLKNTEFVLGNSSSGLLEAPSFNIPTINIGDRQKGRCKAESVIDCKAEFNSISDAVSRAMSEEFRAVARKAVNPYGDGNTSMRIAKEIISALNKGLDLKKKFYDIGR